MTDDLLRRLGDRLAGTHTITRELAGGGMSRVFVARERALNRDVVVKVLPPDLVTDASVARFRREIEFTAGLQHPHILPVYAAGGDAEMLYYFSPYVPGESLRARLQAGPLAADDVVRLAGDVLGALSAAHARGIVHRDVKPGNVLLSGGHAILADFGIARALDADGGAAGSHAEASTLAGARAYQAPERERGPAADLYSVAAMVHEMLVGVPGEPGAGAAQVAQAIARRHRGMRAESAGRLAAVIASGLSRDAAARPRDATAFRAALLAAVAAKGVPARIVAVAAAGATLAVVVLLALRPVGSGGTGGPPTGTPASERGLTSPGALPAAGPSSSEASATGAIAPPAPAPHPAAALTLDDSARVAQRAGRLGEAIDLLDRLEGRAPNPHVALDLALARL
ncbi:MAG: serine/threonine-protein kinase, partial [Gemmatimonadota bacterium]|nr:serine/threonine-protein kinase [Gemmatimonadota bacterium]